MRLLELFVKTRGGFVKGAVKKNEKIIGFQFEGKHLFSRRFSQMNTDKFKYKEKNIQP
jgi:hypothetical protein